MEYTTVQKTAEKWGVTVAFVYTAAKAGRIPGAEQIDGKWHIPEDAENPAKKTMDPKPGYISSAEAAEKWGITCKAVNCAAKEGRIPGAELIGGRWHIPENIEAPLNGRKARLPGYTSASKIAKKWGVSQMLVVTAAKEGRISGAEFIDGRWHIPEGAENPSKSVKVKTEDVSEDTKRPVKRRTDRISGYVSPKEAAKNWGVTNTCVYSAAREGRIPGAKQINGRWYIPEDADNPSKKLPAPKPGYISSAEAAEKWSMTQGSVGVAAKAGRIPDAKQIDGKWYIPENVEAPLNERTDRLPGHISVSKMAEKWGVSQRSVHKAAKDGYISGAKQIDGIWHIPENAVCPIRRKKRRYYR